MKIALLTKHLLIIVLAILSINLSAANRFWIGGTGNWSDASHWAAGSGAGGGASVPTSSDNVFFDANSFSGAGQTLTVDVTANCNTMDWTGATFSPTFNLSSGPINIYGSLTFISNMTLIASQSYYFKSTTSGNTITTAGKVIPHNFYFDGVGGSWTLNDNLTFNVIGIIYLQNGTLNTNGQTVNTVQFSSNNTNVRHLAMGSSVFNVSSGVPWDVQGANFTSDAGTSVVNVSDGTSPNFRGGTGSYNVVNFMDVLANYPTIEGSGNIKELNYFGTGRIYYSGTVSKVHFYKNGRLESNTTIDTVYCEPGITFVINSGNTLTTKKFISNGLCNLPIKIEANPSTASATITSTSAAINFQYTHFKGINAIGSASYTATNSFDYGGNTGITISQPPSQNLYWVGGTGNFNDAAHWSLTSGGAGGACIPTRVDNVFFDANSFSSAGQTVTTNTSPECKNFNWTGATNNPVWAGSSQFDIYGSVTLISGMTRAFSGDIYFKANGTTPTSATITSAGVAFDNHVYFDGENSDWTFADAFTTTGGIYLNKGYLVTNDNPINAWYFYTNGSSNRGLYLGNSTITLSNVHSGTTRSWSVDGSNFSVDAGTSTIISTYNGVAYFSGLTSDVYNNLVFSNPSGTFSVNYGSAYNRVTFNGIGVVGTTASFAKVVFSKTGTLATSCTVDTLQLGGAYACNLGAGTTHNIGKIIVPGTCVGLVAFQTNVPGTQATINATNPISVSYCTFKDINRIGSSFTASNSQDLGNNTGITITAPSSLNLYWVGGAGNWNDPAHWSLTQGGAGGACVPTSADNVFFTTGSFAAGSKIVTMNVPGYCKSMNWTGAQFTPLLAGSEDLNVYGSLTFITGMTISGSPSFTGKVNFRATTIGNTITSAGKTFNNHLTFDGTGSWMLQDALTLNSNSDLLLKSGSLNTNGKIVNIKSFYSSTNASKNLVLGSSIINLSGVTWDVSGSGLTINPGTSIIRFNNTTATSNMYAGNSLNYYDVHFNTGAQHSTMNGNCAFHNIIFYGPGNIYNPLTANKLDFKSTPNVVNMSSVSDTLLAVAGSTNGFGAGSTQTVNRYFNVDGTSGNNTIVQAVGTFTLAVGTGCTVCCNYIDVKNSSAVGSAGYYAANSVNSGGNTGWNFAACPSSTLTVGPITGPTNTCINGTNYTYSIPTVSGGTYAWSVPAGATILSGQGTNSIYVSVGSTAGTVSVTVDACGNTGSATKTITVNPLPTITNISVTPATCSNADGSATATVGGGTPGYYYRWSSGDTLATAPALAAGQYQLIVFDIYGCRATANTSIVASDGPAISVVSTTPTSCYGGTNGTAQVSVSGGTTPYVILWSNGASTLTTTGLTAGPYEVTVTDANECAASQSITIASPAQMTNNFTINPSACAGSTGSAQANVTGGTGAYTYLWDAAANQTTQTANALAAGVYQVIVTDANLCPVTFTATVPNTATTLASAISGVVAGDCGPNSAGTATLDATGGAGSYTYLWSNGATTATISGVTPGTYYCTVTDASLCSSSQSVTIPSSVGSITQAVCMVTVDTATFTNQVIWEKLITNDIQSYKIYRESSIQNVYTNIATVPFSAISEYTDPVANPAIHGWRYKISAIDSCGVETPYSAAHKTIHLAQNLGVGGEINLAWDQYEGFTYYSYYIWRYDPLTGWLPLDTLSTNYTTYTDFTPPSSNSRYMVEVRPQAGCTSTMRIANGGKDNDVNTVVVKSKSNVRNNRAIGIKSDPSINSGFKVYPNPAKDVLNVEFLMQNDMEATITIENMLGQVVYESITIKTNNEINVGGFKAGIYFVKVSTATGLKIEKIIIN